MFAAVRKPFAKFAKYFFVRYGPTDVGHRNSENQQPQQLLSQATHIVSVASKKQRFMVEFGARGASAGDLCWIFDVAAVGLS